MSSSYEQRKTLEKLMGRDLLNHLPRNYNPLNRNRQNLTDPSALESPSICKSFLVGKCPYDMFEGSKEDFGRCPKIHSEKHKILYETMKKKGIKMPNQDYELDYLKDLEAFVNECNRKIRMSEKRLEYTHDEQNELSDISRELDELDTGIGLTVEEIQLLSEKGEIEASLMVSRTLGDLIQRKKDTKKRYTSTLESINQSVKQKLQVCDACGAFLSKLDNDRRLADHFVGKLHMNYVEMRNTLKELKEKHSVPTAAAYPSLSKKI
ncbi:unnamed protein product [Ambrosiozyma monospora]|uniref:Unnamed protein product n=1 Tax=Ambrosiozyma monospora TaxID=43982 RepID=A0A9W6YZE1_AMBMO|nr:unnamed protein product [Ambrosiozyma monospora]